MKKDNLVDGFLVGATICLSVLAIASMAHAQEADLALGRALYEAQDGCALCHGDLGQGDGPAAPFLFPAPRDFTTGIFKVHSTPFLPTDDDLLRTIGEGMPEHSCPPSPICLYRSGRR